MWSFTHVENMRNGWTRLKCEWKTSEIPVDPCFHASLNVHQGVKSVDPYGANKNFQFQEMVNWTNKELTNHVRIKKSRIQTPCFWLLLWWECKRTLSCWCNNECSVDCCCDSALGERRGGLTGPLVAFQSRIRKTCCHSCCCHCCYRCYHAWWPFNCASEKAAQQQQQCNRDWRSGQPSWRDLVSPLLLSLLLSFLVKYILSSWMLCRVT